MEDERITALNLVFDVRDSRTESDEDGDTVGLMDRLDTARGLRRSPIVRFHSTRLTERAPDLLITGELALFRWTVPITLTARPIPTG